MAIAGDIIIKLAADFAEFARGMTESTAMLDRFGKQATTLSGQIETAFKIIKGAAVITALASAVRIVSAELERLESKFTDVAAQAKKLDVSFASFEGLRIAAMKSGTGVDELVGTMTKLKSITDQALQGNAATIDALTKLGVTILDNTGKQRSQEEINRRIAEAFDRMPAGIAKLRAQYALLGEAGEDTDKKLRLLLQGVGDTAAKAQAFTVGKSVEELKKISDEAKAAREQFDLLIASVALPLEVKALNSINAAMQAILKSVREADLYSGNWLVGYLYSRGSLGGQAGPGGSVIPTSALEKNVNDLKEIDKTLGDIRAQIAAGGRDTGYGKLMGDLPEQELAVLKQRAEVQERLNRAIAAGTTITQTMPVTTIPGKPDGSNPSKPGGGGGSSGGGRTDLETVDALIARYGKMQAAAEAASAAMLENVSADIKDLGLIIEAKQAAAEAVAKLEARGIAVSPQKLEELERAVFLSKQAQAEQQRGLQYAQQADETNRRLTDGTKGLAHAVEELGRQYATGRLGIEEYKRALAETAEQQEHVRLQARRYDNDFGSLTAGYQDAALSYSRANDMFSQGGQLFSATSDAMGEGLDALLGKSSKTFEQIAADFALMLAKMALQAALSKVFAAIFGPGMETAGLPGSPYYGPVAPGATARAGGGAADAGQPYWVGEYGPERFVPRAAGRIEPAGGGDVYVSIANYSDSSVSAKKSKGPGGQMQLDILVETLEGRMAGRASRGQGSLIRTVEGRYGLQPVGR